ncbi:DNA polymerase III subunit gamma/tau [Cardinium endosymbiont of Oedothorax gibbosus]|uniref:DNA polymerase III subunit gamma/tau n=1 Tax=Cardinium endosymbiont of Oedothorax gibbosus TaxID=931101 RepID=UPI002023FF3D|nr:DNA polymerase III subunit gamma/tau [Cardinium endosymbiont of Oedothorax gibbosus]CAH2559589.1 DNA polymerase III subunit tau [Cardinium endosymbiont of Oedothorax gibbosus]
MSQFVVSARKYRPTTFKDVISQPHITTTLKNAIASGQLAHAFLFCGPRGVGKTTCARILAKAINCLQVTEAIEPCNQCTNCISLSSNSFMNVHELDAASNNSVEDIRDLVGQVRYAPQLGKYKIYIIDEVHMLSNAAFNAFLKTLEEPPSYALFILATTERHKVLPTILSRCQIFNFNRIKLEDIVTQLKTISRQESIPYEESALQLIAQKAEGAMRDALSMFDLLTTSAGRGGTITYAHTCDHLQILDYDYYFKCTEAFLQGNIPAVLSLYDAVLRAGFNGHHFVVGLGEHLRNLLVCKDNATIPLLEVTDNIRPRYAEYASKCTMPFLLQALGRLNQCDVGYKSSQHQRLHVELALIELATSHLSVPESTVEPLPDTPLPKADGQKEPVIAKSKQADVVATGSSTPLAKSSPIAVHSSSKPVGPAQKPETITIPTLANLKSGLTARKKSNDTDKKIASQYDIKVKEPVSETMVQSFLADYSEQLKKNGHITAYHLMNQPIKIQGAVITISLINPVQEQMLQNLKEELLPALRKKLHHPDITIQSALIEQTSAQTPYTDQEKLTYLSKKNTAIALLQERLMLEVVY